MASSSRIPEKVKEFDRRFNGEQPGNISNDLGKTASEELRDISSVLDSRGHLSSISASETSTKPTSQSVYSASFHDDEFPKSKGHNSVKGRSVNDEQPAIATSTYQPPEPNAYPKQPSPAHDINEDVLDNHLDFDINHGQPVKSPNTWHTFFEVDTIAAQLRDAYKRCISLLGHTIPVVLSLVILRGLLILAGNSHLVLAEADLIAAGDDHTPFIARAFQQAREMLVGLWYGAGGGDGNLDDTGEGADPQANNQEAPRESCETATAVDTINANDNPVQRRPFAAES